MKPGILITAGIGSLLILYAVILSFSIGFRFYRLVWFFLGGALIFGAFYRVPSWMKIGYGIFCLVLIAGCLFVDSQNHKLIKEGEAVEPEVLLVLGCKTPSRAFDQRTDAAVNYLNAHPEAIAVVSGGQGSDEAISEGEAFKTALLNRGIAEARIFTETQSKTTKENLEFSDALYHIKEKPVGIVTNRYHIYRSCLLAKECGYTDVTGIPAVSTLFYHPDNVLREVLALIKAVLV